MKVACSQHAPYHHPRYVNFSMVTHHRYHQRQHLKTLLVIIISLPCRGHCTNISGRWTLYRRVPHSPAALLNGSQYSLCSLKMLATTTAILLCHIFAPLTGLSSRGRIGILGQPLQQNRGPRTAAPVE